MCIISWTCTCSGRYICDCPGMVDWIESHHKYQRAGAPALSWSLKTVSRIRWHTAAQSEHTLCKRQVGDILRVASDGRCFSSAWCATRHPELWAGRAGIEVWARHRCVCSKVNLRDICTSTTAAPTLALRASMPRRPTAMLLISVMLLTYFHSHAWL